MPSLTHHDVHAARPLDAPRTAQRRRCRRARLLMLPRRACLSCSPHARGCVARSACCSLATSPSLATTSTNASARSHLRRTRRRRRRRSWTRRRRARRYRRRRWERRRPSPEPRRRRRPKKKRRAIKIQSAIAAPPDLSTPTSSSKPNERAREEGEPARARGATSGACLCNALCSSASGFYLSSGRFVLRIIF